MALLQQTSARVAGSRPCAKAQPVRRPCVVAKAFFLPERAFAAGLASALFLASPAFAQDGSALSYDEELLQIVKSRGTLLEVPGTEGPAPAKPEVAEAPAVTTAVPLEQRKELIRAEALSESQAAKSAIESASTNAPAAPASRAAPVRKNLSGSGSLSPSSSNAALGVLAVLGLAGGAAYYMTQMNGGAAGEATGAPYTVSAAASPPPPPPQAAPSGAEDKTPTPV